MIDRGSPGPSSVRIIVTLCGALLTLLLSGCSGISWRDWEQNGQKIGRIRLAKGATGYELDYFDMRDRLVREEKRDLQERLVPGSNITVHEYEENLRRTTRVLDIQEKPCLGPLGYALVRYRHGVDEENGAAFTELAHFDVEEQPVQRTDGYHRELTSLLPPAEMEYLESKAPRVWKSEYFTVAGDPAVVSVAGIQKTATVEYSYLQGIGEMVLATHFDGTGNVVGKRRISGIVQFQQSYTSTTTYY